METHTALIFSLCIVVLVAVGSWLYWQRRQTRELRSRFGPEYDQALEKTQSRRRAEADLKAREKRVQQFNLIPLAPQERERFVYAWRSLQNRFVDDPRTAVPEADRLVVDLMQKCGYPMTDFEQRAADISVHHPTVIEHYRAAREIALRNQRGNADTEDLRKALVHYRALFEELLQASEPAGVEVEQ